MPKKGSGGRRTRKPNKRPPGRPTRYTRALADRICQELAAGKSLRKICAPISMPGETTVRRWALTREGFSAQYAQAREIQAMRWAEEVVEIADDSGFDAKLNARGEIVMDGEAIARAKLRVDTRKWLLSKVLPKVYGDRLDVSGPDGGPLQIQIIGPAK